ncbi:MAG: DUF4397 domain-containing protein [Woeseiaceae bacterium]
MKRIFPGLAALLLVACSNDSDLPEATGKANFRMINAIPTSGEISFLVEERSIGTARYKDVTAASEWDDLTYNFNFEAFFAGDSEFTRIATQFVDATANRDYTFMISGSIATPTISLFEDDVREFEETETVFASKFVHASPSSGALDYYFADAATLPAPGGQAATLSFGEISTAADFPEGDYVLTITTAGDSTDVIYQSEPVQFASRNTQFVTLFDADANDRGPLTAEALSATGLSVTMPDPSYPPGIEFVNISMDLGASDIYDDEQLTSLILENHDYLDISGELDVVSGENNFYYTPTGDTTAFVLEGSLSASNGRRYRFYATGVAGDLGTAAVIPDRQPIDTSAKLTMFHGSNNFELLDLYIVDADTSIDDVFPARGAIPPGAQTSTVPLPAGSFDIYITEFGEKVALAGPYRIDATLGDIIDFVAVDAVDPAVVDVLFLSGGPAP